MQVDDTRICNTLRGHDPRGMDLLFDHYYRPLVLWVDTFLNNIPASEDIVQDFFVLFWERRLYVRLTSNNLRAYFFTSVKNLALKYLEKNDPLRNISPTFPLLSEVFNPEEITEEMIQALMAEIEKLPARTREILKAFYYDGMRYREIAEKFAISIATVKTLLAKALKRLREFFSRFTSFF